MVALRFPKSLWSYNPIPTGCVLYLPLWHPNLRTVFKSIDPFGHTCTVTGATKIADGFLWDATGEKITIPDHPSLDVTDALTIMAWVYHGDDASEFILAKRVSGSDDNYSLSTDTAPDKQIFSIFVSDAQKSVTGDTGLTTNKWTLVGGTYNKTDLRTYQNGLLDCTPLAETGTIDITTDDLTIGWGFLDSLTWIGRIGEVWVYNRGLSAEEHLYTYNRTRGRFE